MRVFFRIFLTIWAVFFTTTAYGGMYSWTDENGVKNFSNVKPSRSEVSGAETLNKIKEIPYDREADLNRMVSERLAREERRLDLLKQQQALAKKRLRAANQKAEAIIGEAEDLSQEIESTRSREYKHAKAKDRDGYRVILAPRYGYGHPTKGFRSRHPVLGINPAPRIQKKTGAHYPNRKRQEYKSHIKKYYRKHGYIQPDSRPRRRHPRPRPFIREATGQ
ncbi:MAG: DUF4124 domain-containing protein [Thermodesulfobacteriota bacterium]